jgi:hypothetical protein
VSIGGRAGSAGNSRRGNAMGAIEGATARGGA